MTDGSGENACHLSYILTPEGQSRHCPVWEGACCRIYADALAQSKACSFLILFYDEEFKN